jgi:hypothetical protein
VKPKQLASILGVTDTEIIRAGVQLKIVGIGFKKELSDDQVCEIKEYFSRVSVPQLSAGSESPEPVQLLQDATGEEGAIEQSTDAIPESAEVGIAQIRQTALSNAMAASESQQSHILESEIQQAADDGLRAGVVKELVRATKEREGAMLVRDAVFHRSQKSRDRLNELLKDSAGDDFLTTSQLSSQTYAQTAKIGAATMMDTHQALKNLGVEL